MLYKRVLELKQATSGITTNPTLDAFSGDECKMLDSFYNQDETVREKINNCLNLLEGLSIDYNVKYKSAYEEYNEAITYIELSDKFSTTRIPESSTKTPDFNIKRNDEDSPIDLYVEVKALSFLDGNLNYIQAQKDSLKANLSIEKQQRSGRRIASAETIISPFSKNGKSPNFREVIEIYIEKIQNNIKEGQFQLGDTVLLIDLKQLLPPNNWYESGLAIYQERMYQSMVSGTLWHTAFGQIGDMIFAPIKFEGEFNVDSKLEKNGILIDYPFIKGLIFAVYENFQERRYLGFYRHNEQAGQIADFISGFCNFYNDDKNTNAFRVLQK